MANYKIFILKKSADLIYNYKNNIILINIIIIIYRIGTSLYKYITKIYLNRQQVIKINFGISFVVTIHNKIQFLIFVHKIDTIKLSINFCSF